MEIQKGYCEDCRVETNTKYCKDCGKLTLADYEKCKECKRTIPHYDKLSGSDKCFWCSHVMCDECGIYYLKKDGYCKKCAWNCENCKLEIPYSKYCPHCGEGRPEKCTIL